MFQLVAIRADTMAQMPARTGARGARLAMNAHAYRLVVTLRAVLAPLPGATAISIHASTAWTLVLITAASDEAVSTLSEALGLSAPEVRIAAGRWWCRATAERDAGRLRFEVTGPHHLGSPPR
jgi:hypothetical protein